MKKNNYFFIHKNKNPKKLKPKKFNKTNIELALIAFSSFAQHSMILSQKFNSVAEKSMAIFENVKNQSDAVINLFKKQKSNRYLQSKKILKYNK